MSVDMEGATGVTNFEDVLPGKPSYERFRKLLTSDVNAAVEGAIDGGADKVVINEAHNTMRNVLIEDLHLKVELISGLFTKPLLMMEGVDKEPFDVAFLIAYHAKKGTKSAVLCHTLALGVNSIKINDQIVGETAISAATAGYYNVPVGLVTGDDKVVKESIGLLGHVETAIVKEGMDRMVAQCLSVKESTKRIKEAAKRACDRVDEFCPYQLDPPIKFEIEFSSTNMASAAILIPAIHLVEPKTISFTTQDFVEGLKLCNASIILASAAGGPIVG